MARLTAKPEPTVVAPADRPAVVYHLVVAGWGTGRIAKILAMTPREVRAARSRGHAVATYVEALAKALPWRAA
ncbi:hypothetical protein [Streptomyces sp. NPDC005125]